MCTRCTAGQHRVVRGDRRPGRSLRAQQPLLHSEGRGAVAGPEGRRALRRRRFERVPIVQAPRRRCAEGTRPW